MRVDIIEMFILLSGIKVNFILIIKTIGLLNLRKYDISLTQSSTGLFLVMFEIKMSKTFKIINYFGTFLIY